MNCYDSFNHDWLLHEVIIEAYDELRVVFLLADNLAEFLYKGSAGKP
jgi:hypothetical protein